MRNFKGKVAVVTGAASGIGLAIARQASTEGMNVVLADIDKEALANASIAFREIGEEALSVVTDVGDAESVEALSQKCYETFGAVDLLCNNAGVGTGSDIVDSA